MNLFIFFNISLFVSYFIFLLLSPVSTNSGDDLITANDIKQFKKILRTRVNVLVIFLKDGERGKEWIAIGKVVAKQLKGKATIMRVNCGENKKVCKRLKIDPSPTLLLHYMDGEPHKIYDRKMTEASMTHFLLNPKEGRPWHEEETASSIHHLQNEAEFGQLVNGFGKTKKIFVMFYAPWCKACQQMKPEFVKAAKEVGDSAIFAAMSVDTDQYAKFRQQMLIAGYPTLMLLTNGEMVKYSGKHAAADIVAFVKNPTKTNPAVETPKNVLSPSFYGNSSDVLQLSNANFSNILGKEASALVMFYAPWCGHCKNMKPGFSEAASEMKTQNISGILAAVDCTLDGSLCEQFKLTGYPSLKYFSSGEFKFNFFLRTKEGILNFMKEPKDAAASPPPPSAPVETPWSEENNKVVHLTEDSLAPYLKKKKHVLVLFYYSFSTCDLCLQIKPEYEAAAEKLKKNSKMELAAVNCSADRSVSCQKYTPVDHPAIIHFTFGKKPVGMNKEVSKDAILKFIADPYHDEL